MWLYLAIVCWTIGKINHPFTQQYLLSNYVKPRARDKTRETLAGKFLPSVLTNKIKFSLPPFYYCNRWKTYILHISKWKGSSAMQIKLTMWGLGGSHPKELSNFTETFIEEQGKAWMTHSPRVSHMNVQWTEKTLMVLNQNPKLKVKRISNTDMAV